MKAKTNKLFYEFAYFDELQIGDVFKFSPILDSEIPSTFFTVYAKDEKSTKASSTYGKKINWIELSNNIGREVLIYPGKKRIIK